MKKFALLLFFVIPHLMYASFETHACTKALDRVDAEWTTRTTLLVQFDALPLDNRIPGVPLIREAIESCHRAIGHCDYILGKIEHKSKREREQHYWTHVKGECKQYKTAIFQEIDRLNELIPAVYFDDAKRKAETVRQKGVAKAGQADKMRQEHPRRLDNVEEVRGMLSDAVKLYEEANSIIKEVNPILAQYSDIEPIHKFLVDIQKAMEAYQNEILHCQKESIDWAETIVNIVKKLNDELASLVAEKDMLIEQGNAEKLKETENKMISVIKQLIDRGAVVPKELKELIDKPAQAGQ